MTSEIVEGNPEQVPNSENPLSPRFYGMLPAPGEKADYPDVLLGDETAIFNGAFFTSKIDGKKRTFCFPRVMNRPQVKGTTDTTGRFDCWEVTRMDGETGMHTTAINHIPSEVIKGTAKENPEDARALVLRDDHGEETGEVFFGISATDEANGRPYPAFFSARYPFSADTVTPMEVLSHLPPGKNVLPLSEDLAVYRPEHNEDKTVNGDNFTFIKKIGNRWEQLRSITFPPVDWVEKGKNAGRFGFTGGERIPTGELGIFRMIIHASSNSNGDKDHIVTYSLGLATCKEREDGTFDVLEIDNEPLLTYDEAIQYAGDGTEPDPVKRVIYSVGYTINEEGEALVQVTFRDKQIGVFGFTRERLLKPFTPTLEKIIESSAPYRDGLVGLPSLKGVPVGYD